MEPKKLVKKGYDNLGESYSRCFKKVHLDKYPIWLNTFLKNLAEGSSILDLGCANGMPVAKILSKDFDYLGVDISPVQIEQARYSYPEANFLVSDFTKLSFARSSFDAILAFYSIIHIPLEDQQDLISSIYQWLRPNGIFMAIVGAKNWTGTENDWLEAGISMYWSHTDIETYLTWFTSTGFILLDKQFVPEGNGGHFLLVVKK